MESNRFSSEVLKLLVQMAWADDVIAASEAALILGSARVSGAPEDLIANLQSALRGEIQPPAPDLGLLRQHRAQTLVMARQMIECDGIVVGDEQACMATLEELLED